MPEIPDRVRNDKIRKVGNAPPRGDSDLQEHGGVSKKMKATFQNVARGKIENENVARGGVSISQNLQPATCHLNLPFKFGKIGRFF